MKILAAAIQMASEPEQIGSNLERAESLVRQAHQAGAALVVLPEMFSSGYGLLPDYTHCAEGRDGPTIRLLSRLSRDWNLAIAGGFVERDGHHLYDALAFTTPDGRVHVYRKRNLVFWERFRFRPGRDPLVVSTPFGRVGFAICADMIYRRVWDAYRDRIDIAVVAAAWPRFTCAQTGKPHWLFGHVGPMSGAIPCKVANDLGVPVVFSNQCGSTRTTIPLLGTWLSEKLPDRFAGSSSICDGRHGDPVLAGAEELVLISPITVHSRGPKQWRSTYRSVPEASSFVSEAS